MTKHAFLIEDDVEQVEFTRDILVEHGFSVVTSSNFEDATVAVESLPRPVDLVVLDRRLPKGAEDEPSDEVGDELLDRLLDLLPDSPFVVFTGYTGVLHHQFATQERGVLEIGPRGETQDRVSAYEKSQTIDFDKYVGRLSERLDALNDIEVAAGEAAGLLNPISRRLLQKVARHFGGVSISADPLTGGLADLPVWKCSVRSGEGQEIASVVVKQSDGKKVAPPAGLHTLLPAAYVAAPVATIAGLCDGHRAQIMQFAGARPTSLLALLLDDEVEAARHLRQMADAINASSSGSRGAKTLAELVDPLIKWGTLTQRLMDLKIAAPRGVLMASTRTAPRHGDLHPGNVLVVEGRPVLIDFDNEVVGSAALDAVTALLSPLFHRDSPIRDVAWPSPEQCEQLGTAGFLEGSPCRAWMEVAQQWLEETVTSDRERDALILAFAVRQFKYPDVNGSEIIKARAAALARTFSSRLIGG